MAERVPMIALSPTMDKGTVARWRKKTGEAVKTGDVLCEVETDKATMDYESTVEGTLLAILVPEGESAAVGEPIAVVGEPGEDISALLGQAPPQAVPASASATAPGRSKEPPAPENPQAPRSLPAREASSSGGDGRVRSSPLARKMAIARGIALTAVPGTGPSGRVVKRDIEALAREKPTPAPSLAGRVGISPSAAEAVAPAQPDQVLRLSAMRKTIAKRMLESVSSAPHYYLTVSANMEELLSLRRKLNDALAEEAAAVPKVSLNAFLIKLSAEALKRHPRVNASWTGESIILRGSIDIGVAVALADGLVAPVVRNCGGKRLLDIQRELEGLVERTLAGKIAPEEYAGATFTISNLGTFGIEEFTSIINPPGSAILSVGEARKTAVVEGDAVVARTMMRATLACDHRVIDGAVGAAFLSDLKRMLEAPARALL